MFHVGMSSGFICIFAMLDEFCYILIQQIKIQKYIFLCFFPYFYLLIFYQCGTVFQTKRIDFLE